MSFAATPNTNYYIAVAGYDGSTGNITMNWSQQVVTNDNFADAILLTGNGGSIESSSLGATIQARHNDDEVPTLSADDISITEGNSGNKVATVTVTLSKTANGTATAGEDYLASTGTLTIAPGQLSKTINFAVKGDLINEPNETFAVNLMDAVGAVVSKSGSVTITNDDVAAGINRSGGSS